MPIRILKKDEDTNREKGLKKSKMLTGGQAKIAAKAPPPNKIDEKDFAVLRAEKAKGRGMGLQDEKVKPGKVQKAALGMLALGMMGKKYLDKKKSSSSAPMMGAAAELMKKKKEILGKRMGGVMKYKRGMGPGGLDLPVISSVKPAVHKTKKAQKTAVMKEQFNKQKSRTLDYAKKKGLPKPISLVAKGVQAMPLPGRLKLLKSLGKLPFVKGIGKKDVKKKMGGGMMQKPMGYRTGGGYDSGNPGKLRDIVTKYAGKFKSKDRLTERDIETANKILKGGRGKAYRSTQEMVSRLKKFDSAKKMGGGMMQKPMGYKSGSKLMDFIKSGSYTDKYGTKTNVDKAIKKINLSPKNKDLATMKPASNKKMMGGGMMMQRPMGYKYGTSVKAKCKLGRNKPTKIT